MRERGKLVAVRRLAASGSSNRVAERPSMPQVSNDDFEHFFIEHRNEVKMHQQQQGRGPPPEQQHQQKQPNQGLSLERMMFALNMATQRSAETLRHFNNKCRIQGQTQPRQPRLNVMPVLHKGVEDFKETERPQRAKLWI
ncbi:hypothetical protein QAD02_020167 [Eretmocerus hayati]|uniref:Uncharacterized protein n=1 Tax=Eretmocerus hayati TaxID=131215 RepID=A0ACC2PRG0_9HYME|nr:hypothetical protein QAD02_020167 [Eretmocerus hayati]